jgi:phospholipase D1/2
MIDSTMAGKPYQVGRFAHTLRLRLMREHLGLDTDAILEQEREEEGDGDSFEQEMDEIYGHEGETPGTGPNAARRDSLLNSRPRSFNYELDMERARALDDHSSASISPLSDGESEFIKAERTETGMSLQQQKTRQLDVSGYGPDHWKAAEQSGLDEGRDSVVVDGREVLIHDINDEGKGTLCHPTAPRDVDPASNRRHVESSTSEDLPPMPPMNRRTTEQLGLLRPAQLPPLPVADDTDIGGPAVHIDPKTGRPKSGAFHPMAADITPAVISKDCMRDPLLPSFIDDVWNRAANNNTKIYRRVFRCMPDSDVKTWQEYREYMDYEVRFRASMDGRPAGEEADLRPETGNKGEGTAAGAGIGAPGPMAIVAAAKEKMTEKLPFPEQEVGKSNVPVPQNGETGMNEKAGGPIQRAPGPLHSDQINGTEKTTDNTSSTGFPALEEASPKRLEAQVSRNTERKTAFSALDKPPSRETAAPNPAQTQFGSVRKRRRAATKGSRRGFSIDDMPSRQDAGELLKMIQGSIVQFPYDWLATEQQNGNWGYQVDGVAPLSI